MSSRDQAGTWAFASADVFGDSAVVLSPDVAQDARKTSAGTIDASQRRCLDFMRERTYSEETAQKIDQEVRKIVTTAHDRAMSLLKKHRDKLKKIAAALLEREVLDGEEIDRLCKGRGLAAMAVPAARANMSADAINFLVIYSLSKNSL